MAQSYRVIDLRPDAQSADAIIVDSAKSPESAAREALGLDLVRSGAKKDLVAQVYWQLNAEAKNMVRLYSRVATHRRRQGE